ALSVIPRTGERSREPVGQQLTLCWPKRRVPSASRSRKRVSGSAEIAGWAYAAPSSYEGPLQTKPRSTNMVDTLNPTQLAQIVSAVIQALQVQGAASAKPASQPSGNSLETKDRALVAGFKRRGIPVAEITLMDRNDPKKPYNVKPFKAWLTEGRMVRKGQYGIRGLFHISQTDVIAPAKPAPKGKPKSPDTHTSPRFAPGLFCVRWRGRRGERQRLASTSP